MSVRKTYYPLILLSLVQQCLSCETVLEGIRIRCSPTRTESMWACSLKNVNNTSASLTEKFSHDLQMSCSENPNNSGNDIYKIRSIKITNIATFDASNIRLEAIQPGAFKNLPNSMYFYFNNNHLRKIETGTFLNLNVYYLDLSNNFISVLETESFVNLPEVKILNLKNNQIKIIPKEVFNNVSVSTIYFNNNRISYIEAGAFDGLSADRLRKRIYISLNYNNIQEINPNVFKIEKMRALELNGNSISVLRPGDLANLPDVKLVFLSRNELKQISEGVFNGSQIEFIDFSYNEISVIHTNAFYDMEKLETVKIDHNILNMWNYDWFGGSTCNHPLTVDVSHNDIDGIPSEARKSCQDNKSCIIPMH